jgi:hypothetical protein
MGDITDGGDGSQNVTELDLALVPAHPGAVRGVVDPKFQHAGQRIDMPFVEPDAGGANDAFQNQRGFADMLAFDADETLL